MSDKTFNCFLYIVYPFLCYKRKFPILGCPLLDGRQQAPV